MCLIVLGAVNMARPWRWLGIKTRGQAFAVAACGLAIVVVGMILPVREKQVARASTHLDEIVPVYQFNEVHRIEVNAQCSKTYDAVTKVTGNEIQLMYALLWIRRMGRRGPESILNLPDNTPVLEVALRNTFLKLAEDPPRELVVGTVVKRPENTALRVRQHPELYGRISEPGWAMGTMNFLLVPNGDAGCTVTTETRVFATSPDARRAFAAYWRVIYPGSSLIRHMWLKAIKERAEA